MLGRTSCLKIFSKECSSSLSFEKRLRAFAGACATKEIPGIPRIFEAGRIDDQLFIATEWLEGYLPVETSNLDTMDLMRALAERLDNLHEKGLSYLGLKPQHLLVNSEGNIALSAFGFAEIEDPMEALKKIAVDVGEKRVSALQEAFVFLSPEQKKKLRTGPGSDWYALGILLYYLVEKRLPDVGARLKDPALNKLFYALVHPEPSSRTFQLEEKSEPKAHVSTYRPRPLSHTHVEPIPIDMVVIPEGRYSRGSKYGPRDEMPHHEVHLSSFAIDIHPVTNEQFVRFLEAMGDIRSEKNNDFIRLKDSRVSRSQISFLIESGYAKHPVVGVTWYGAKAYADWLGKRLPTEAQWEAAAGGAINGAVGTLYPTGEQIDKKSANFFNNDTTAVMSYPPSINGLYDMAGNVYEWCQDWYDFHAYDLADQEPKDPVGPRQGVYRVLRGGCWKSLENDLRTAHRHRNNPGSCEATYGFRCVSMVEEKALS
jgi:formylglycine-generating enzyme required for sulfatase activity